MKRFLTIFACFIAAVLIAVFLPAYEKNFTGVAMASAEELRAALGVEPGSVTPLGLVNAPPGSVRFVLDAAIAYGDDPLWCHPLRNTASTAILPAELRRFLEGLGHQVLVLELPEGEP